MKTKLSLLLASAILASCSTNQVEDRDFADRAPSAESQAFDQLLSRVGLNVYFANLHAHHFMETRQGKKSTYPPNFLGPGICDEYVSFPQDDGRPCRNDNGENKYVIPPSMATGTVDRLDYFRMACDYAKEKGELDILFITPHAKNNEGDGDTDTPLEGFVARQAELKKINEKFQGSFLCGLGQESSSISKGNHVNIFGHFRNESGAEPFFFPNGEFHMFYPQVKTRAAKGEQIILQMNHPEAQGVKVSKDGYVSFHGDLHFGSMKSDPADKSSTKFLKDKLNDYGTDDYAPVACLFAKAGSVPGCESAPQTDRATLPMLKQTFANMQKEGADHYRLIEVTETGSVEKTGATSNFKESFLKVHDRASKPEKYLSEGLFSYIFYLNMGFKLGPVANQDNHFMNYGSALATRTGVLAKDLSETQVFGALENRATFASEDRNAKIVLTGYTGVKHVVMGQDLEIASGNLPIYIGYRDSDETAPADLTVYVYNEADQIDFSVKENPWNPVRTIQFVGNKIEMPSGPTEPSVLKGALGSGKVKALRIPLKPGKNIVFVEVTQADKDRILSAPLFVNSKAGQ